MGEWRKELQNNTKIFRCLFVVVFFQIINLDNFFTCEKNQVIFKKKVIFPS